MTAYLTMMAPRLVELHRVSKPTGSLYLHCDPTARHYLKIMLDAIFGPQQFVNEIIWKRTSSHNDAKQGSKHYGRINDVLLFYSKTANYHWEQTYRPYDEEYTDSRDRRTPRTVWAHAERRAEAGRAPIQGSLGAESALGSTNGRSGWSARSL
ncbi:MAG: DNA methyltransferase [Tepidiformaceae bacterium]